MDKAKKPAGCDLCGDQPGPTELMYVRHLRSRCHLTAPLAARLEGDVLVLSCYVPECGREVARFRVAEVL